MEDALQESTQEATPARADAVAITEDATAVGKRVAEAIEASPREASRRGGEEATPEAPIAGDSWARMSSADRPAPEDDAAAGQRRGTAVENSTAEKAIKIAETVSR